MSEATLVLRAPTAGDVHLIAQTYVRGARRAFERAQLSVAEWDSVAEQFVGACIDAKQAIVLGHPVSGPGDTCAVAGYILGTRQRGGGAVRALIHWVYVTEPWRRRGLARVLVGALTDGADEVVITHTKTRRHRREARARGWQVVSSAPWLWMLARQEAS